ncbi:dihydroxyacetone kinase family protein [Phycicoccus sonneratiae]|uniref:Dihydroxyacetone kinase family protein n=1 Tax=Phycicoccus sonneratiae TaxID=2807628 RepID=A0ABS2CPR0_9MICO|nr:dihydroxyacetone kinase family protein [Phycicoccus sonneraticus]MBM6401798.1 dihydroxyacetone kinase family protein [Phycicoccus sonneraticus]
MTHIHDDPSQFKEEVIAGFALAYARYVRRVPGAAGFVRRGGPGAGKVSLVVGGGSGHYPSYSGVTGAGFADGAVLGDVFTSPSTEQVYRVARAASGGGGVVLAFGNYAGDRLNFGAAQKRLVEEGIDTRVVYVTDDVASAPLDEKDRRRGIAGTFTVYKVGGAAADRGDSLDEVERLMRLANDRTSSFGVAFDGCTLPGRDDALFHVEDGRMDFGLGIHGEPGISSAPWMPAPELAAALVEKVLAERPADASGRAAVLVNGLGATKYEELFVLYGHVARLLEEAGVDAVQPEVGELVTSLDMAGCSLSVTWLDGGLEELWVAPADTPAFRRGDVGELPTYETVEVASTADEHAVDVTASEESRAAVPRVRAALDAMTAAVEENEAELGRIDAIAGDGDHGLGMVRGCRAAREAAHGAAGGAGAVLAAAADAFGDKAGGTSGILWGILLSGIGAELGNEQEVTAEVVAAAVTRGLDAVQAAGGAQVGDKTLVDALVPFAETLRARVGAGDGLGEAWSVAASAAVDAAHETASLTPRLGRARPLAERSIGTPDAGAVSMGLIVTAVGAVLAGESVGSTGGAS